MRQLEVVAVSDDGTHVLLAASSDAARASHQVRIDDRLLAAVRGELDTSERRPSALSPKEIQSRLRAGEPAEDVARAARIPLSRVLRYAGPVDSERERILDQARSSHLRRPRGQSSPVTLGEAIDRRLAAVTSLRPDSVTWTARRREDGAWVIGLGYLARGGQRAGSWLWQPTSRELTALDAASSRLAAVETSAAAGRPRPAATRRAAPRRPVAAGRAAATRSPRPAAVTAPAEPAGPAATVTETADAQTDAPAAATPAKRPNGRVPVPSWSDVLLGVQPAPEPPPRPARSRGRRRS